MKGIFSRVEKRGFVGETVQWTYLYFCRRVVVRGSSVSTIIIGITSCFAEGLWTWNVITGQFKNLPNSVRHLEFIHDRPVRCLLGFSLGENGE